MFGVINNRKADDKLKASEERYRRLFETAQDGILLIDFKTGMILDANKFLLDILGYAKKDLLRKYLWEAGFFNDRAASKANFLTLQKKKYVRFEDLPLETKSGKAIDVEFVANAYEAGGDVIIQCNIRNISDRKKIEKEKEEILHNMNERVKELNCIYSIGSIIEIPNITLDQILKKIVKIMPAAWQYPNITAARILLDQNVSQTSNFKETKWMQSADIIVNKKKAGCVEVFYLEKKTDSDEGPFLKQERNLIANIAERLGRVAERKKAEGKNQWLASFPLLNPMPIMEIDKAKGIVFINPSVQRIFPDLLAKQVNHPFVKGATDYFKKLRFPKQTQDEREILVNGSWYLQSFSLVRPYLLRIYGIDITRRKIAENDLRKNEEKMRTVFALTPTGISILNDKKQIIDVNPAMGKILGLSREELLKGTYRSRSYLRGDGSKKPKNEFASYIANKENRQVMNDKTGIVKENGKIVWTLVSAAPLPDAGMVITTTDISELMTAEQVVKDARDQLDAIVNTVKDPLLVLDKNLKVLSANKTFCEFFKTEKIKAIGKPICELCGGQWNIKKLNILLKTIVPRETQIRGFEITHNFKGIGLKTLLLNSREISLEGGKTKGILLAIEDITERRIAEGLLSASETKYRRLFESAKDGILIIDALSGKIIDVNQFLIDLLQYSHKQILAKKIWNLGLFKDIAVNKAQFIKLQKRGYVRYEDMPLKTAKGKLINVEFVSNVYNVDNQKVIQCNIRDITDRKKAEQLVNEVKTRDEAILNSIGDAVLACDEKGIIQIFNKMAEQLTGFSAKEVIGRHYHKGIRFIKESDGRPSSDFIKEAINGKEITKMASNSSVIRKDGGKIPVADSAAPIKDKEGLIIGVVVVFRDATQERKIDRVKTEFVSLASHELRTPLSTVNWYTEVLLSKDLGTLNAKQEQYIREVYSASQRMVSLVDALLNVSRLELGALAIEPKLLSIAKVVNLCVQEYKPQILEKKLVLREKYDTNVSSIKADPKLVSIIVRNILSNAIKYTPKTGRIIIKVSKQAKDILITVADTGVGIPTRQKNKIFTKLFRADNVKKVDPNGTGLGLYIVNEIINQAGGKVWFESKEGKGTTFYVSLPLTGMAKRIGTKQLIIK
jgi:PAS domain S-box-containing protein